MKFRKYSKLRTLVPLQVLGVLLPGTALIATRRRIIGGTILFVYLLALGFLGYLYFTGQAENIALTIGSSTSYLFSTFIGCIVLGVAWIVLIIVNHAVLTPRKFPTTWRKVVAIIVSILLALAVAAPTSAAAFFSYRTYDLLRTVFSAPPTPINTPVPSGSSSYTPAPTTSPTEDTPPWQGLERVNVMLLGSDAGSDRVGIRPDTIIVASIDAQTGDTVLLTLPRNLQYPQFPKGTVGAKAFPKGFTFEQGLINSAWEWAEENKQLFPNDSNPGLTATSQLVSNALGLDINYYTVVNMQGFEDIVNSLGGVTVNVPRDLPIGKTGGPYSGYVKKGQNRHLDGYDALWYVRSRADSSDYDRMDRSRCMISALTDQISAVQVLTSFSSLSETLKENVYTDVQAQDLKYWAQLLLKVKNNDIRSLAFTNDVISPVRPDYDKLHELVQEALNPQPVQPSAPVTTSPNSGDSNSSDTSGENKTSSPVEATSEVC